MLLFFNFEILLNKRHSENHQQFGIFSMKNHDMCGLVRTTLTIMLLHGIAHPT